MADTRHVKAAPVEGDGVNYGGIIWFIVILTGTTLACQLLVWGGFALMEHFHVTRAGIARVPLATPPAQPSVGTGEQKGRVLTGLEGSGTLPITAYQPGLLVDEPSVLATFHRREQESLTSYGWVDRSGGVVRIPIDRAKDLVIERGLRARSDRPAGAQPLPPLATPPAPAATGGSAAKTGALVPPPAERPRGKTNG